ncbi:MAG TPA: hypothetical protein VFN10_22505 [Thermoanaerobaculia bacterium]|nr:hypothetical protein [Thermoanaerobaculia bacterium]
MCWVPHRALIRQSPLLCVQGSRARGFYTTPPVKNLEVVILCIVMDIAHATESLPCDMVFAVTQAAVNRRLDAAEKRFEVETRDRQGRLTGSIDQRRLTILGDGTSNELQPGRFAVAFRFGANTTFQSGEKRVEVAASVVAFRVTLQSEKIERGALESPALERALAEYGDDEFDIQKIFAATHLIQPETDFEASASNAPWWGSLDETEKKRFFELMERVFQFIDRPSMLAVVPIARAASGPFTPTALRHAAVYCRSTPERSTLNFLMMTENKPFPDPGLPFVEHFVPNDPYSDGVFAVPHDPLIDSFLLPQIVQATSLPKLFKGRSLDFDKRLVKASHSTYEAFFVMSEQLAAKASVATIAGVPTLTVHFEWCDRWFGPAPYQLSEEELKLAGHPGRAGGADLRLSFRTLLGGKLGIVPAVSPIDMPDVAPSLNEPPDLWRWAQSLYWDTYDRDVSPVTVALSRGLLLKRIRFDLFLPGSSLIDCKDARRERSLLCLDIRYEG